jgi:hypothetical protein
MWTQKRPHPFSHLTAQGVQLSAHKAVQFLLPSTGKFTCVQCMEFQLNYENMANSHQI